MTAHALKGDRELCLAAGMDGYISKPFRREQVIQEIEALRMAAKETLPWNREQALSFVAGNAELLDELLRIFADEWPATRDRLHHARDEHDPEALAALAHLLKGELPCLGCTEASGLAARIEELVRGDNWDAAQPALVRLEAALEGFVAQWQRAREDHEIAHRR